MVQSSVAKLLRGVESLVMMKALLLSFSLMDTLSEGVLDSRSENETA